RVGTGSNDRASTRGLPHGRHAIAQASIGANPNQYPRLRRLRTVRYGPADHSREGGTPVTHTFRRALTLRCLLAGFARLTSSAALAANPGTLDTTFGGGDGMATFSLSGGAEDLGTVLATTGGKILLFGEDDDASDMALARMAANGDPDITFGGG